MTSFPEGLSLLGTYEDSDDEEAGDSTVKSQSNQPADIDSTLANFMAVSMVFIITKSSLLQSVERSIVLSLMFIYRIKSQIYLSCSFEWKWVVPGSFCILF